jgi:hypothetical protein
MKTPLQFEFDPFPWKVNGYGKEQLDSASLNIANLKYFAEKNLKEYQMLGG